MILNCNTNNEIFFRRTLENCINSTSLRNIDISINHQKGVDAAKENDAKLMTKTTLFVQTF